MTFITAPHVRPCEGSSSAGSSRCASAIGSPSSTIDEQVDRAIVGVGSANRSYSILSLPSFGLPSKVYSAELSFGS